eukprot:scpid48922/ scgid23113/ 
MPTKEFETFELGSLSPWREFVEELAGKRVSPVLARLATRFTSGRVSLRKLSGESNSTNAATVPQKISKITARRLPSARDTTRTKQLSAMQLHAAPHAEIVAERTKMSALKTALIIHPKGQYSTLQNDFSMKANRSAFEILL